MMVVDTSALLAVVMAEAGAARCAQAMADDQEILISAGTLAEIFIVAGRRGILAEVSALIERLGITAIPVTEFSAKRAGEAHLHWGKGSHPAGLNFGDCFAYELAKTRGAPLLFIGEDFSRTDLASVL